MQLLPNGWHVPYGVQQCTNLNASFACDFALYSSSNSMVLAEDAKLAPNPDITGDLIFQSFIWTAFMSLLLSGFLCLDKIYYRITRNRPKQITTHERYLKLIHTIETLLHTFSDQQLVSAISLLFTLNDQACTISAYDFNLVCTMLLISVVVHLNSLIMISDFIFKGKAIAFSRIVSIALQLTLTGIVFSARNTAIFPFEPQALAIMPAACFENTNATSSVGLADFANLASNITTNATLTATNSTGNGTETLWHNLEAATSTTHGLPEYIVLVIFVFFAVLTLLAEWIGTETGWNRHIGWGSIVVSITSTITSISLTGYAFSRYSALTKGMMVADLYQLAAVTPLTLSQLLPLTLLTSSLFPVINAVVGSLPTKSRRFANLLEQGEKTFEQGVKGYSSLESLQKWNSLAA